jgi:hypothetical protein
VGCDLEAARSGGRPTPPGPLVLAALLVAVAVSRVAQPSRSDAVGALDSATTTSDHAFRGALQPSTKGVLPRRATRATVGRWGTSLPQAFCAD